ncbi:MAG: site-2 protease family protein [Planctomycetota bacterium]
MPFADPSPTPADLNFRLLGFPVRVHPFFWIVCLLLGPGEPERAVLWFAAVFVSILVHELGHAVLQRHWGGRPSIILYGFGGLASAPGVRDTPWRQIAISLAGPGAGFVLAALVYLVAPQVVSISPMLATLASFLLAINIFWGIFNLLPIYPLDGGRVSREVFTMVLRPDRGIVVSLWVSMIACAIAAVLMWQWTGSLWNVVLLAAIGINNYQTLEQYRSMRGGGWR